MYYLDPYQTAPGQGYELSELKETILDELRTDSGRLFRESERIYFVDDRLKELKPFAHPICIELDRGISRDHDRVIVADTRASARYKRETDELAGGVDFEYQKVRAHLMDKVWIDGNSSDHANLSDLPARVMVTLIGELMARKLSVEDMHRRHIEALVSVYYVLLHMDTETQVKMNSDERNRLSILRRASRVSSIPVFDIENYLGDLDFEEIADIDRLCHAIRTKVDSKRVDRITPAGLYQISGGVWFGAHATEMIAVSYEHPPSFSAMIYTHIAHRAYPKSILAQLIKRIDRRRDQSTEFAKRVERIVNLYKHTLESDHELDQALESLRG